MKKILNLFSAVLVCLVINQTTVLASSHREAPLIAFDPLADNTDLYAFRSPVDTNNVVLIANYIPFELPQGGPNYYTFGENVRYEIHVKNGMDAADEIVYRFTFKHTNQDPTTFFNIRLGRQNLKTTYTLERKKNGVFETIISNGVVPPNNIGPRSIENSTVGLGKTYDYLVDNAIMTATSGEKVFCGPRDDPFFVDLGGAFDVGNFRQPGKDGLAKFNVHSIAIEVPISTLQKNGKTTKQAANILDPEFVIGVWATASRRAMTTFNKNGGSPSTTGSFIQISRLGMPLTNEVVIPIGQKDRWNSVLTNSPEELSFAANFTNPELALYMDDSQFGGAVPGLADLRIQSNSLNSFDFRNGHKGLWDLKRTSAVVGTALDSTLFGPILLPDSMSPRAVDLLPIFYTGVPNLPPYQLATGKQGNPLAVGKPFINNFLPTLGDMLRLNMAVPVTPRNDKDFSSLGIVYAAVLGLTREPYNTNTNLEFIPNMDGFPNGRRLEDDVTTIELQAVSGVALAAIGLWYDDFDGSDPVTPMLGKVLGFNAGVTENDTTFRTGFPYLQTPWRGFVGPSYEGTLIELPLNWTSFIAEGVDQKANLRWYVSNEVNNDHYEVEHSLNGSSFEQVGTVKAINGSRNTYTYVHNDPILKVANYYRIKQVDVDGKFTYSPIRVVKFFDEKVMTISPNPTTSSVRINSSRYPITVHVFDNNGKKVATRLITSGTGDINMQRFAPGTYIIVAESNGTRIETKRIIKN